MLLLNVVMQIYYGDYTTFVVSNRIAWVVTQFSLLRILTNVTPVAILLHVNTTQRPGPTLVKYIRMYWNLSASTTASTQSSDTPSRQNRDLFLPPTPLQRWLSNLHYRPLEGAIRLTPKPTRKSGKSPARGNKGVPSSYSFP